MSSVPSSNSTSLASVDPVVAAFDVDGTLTVRDCVLPFLLRAAGPGRFAWRVSGRLSSLIKSVARRDRDAVKEILVSAALAGASVEETELLGARFAGTVATSWMRPDVAERLRWHQDQGHIVVLVSASLSPYLQPLGDALDVDAVICTELDAANGVYSGSLRGPNCRAAEKVNRLRSWATEAGITGEEWLQYAYGDSAGDTAMLGMAAQGVNVSRQEVWS